MHDVDYNTIKKFNSFVQTLSPPTAMDSYSLRSFYVVYCVLVKGMNYKQIADELGVTRDRVRKIKENFHCQDYFNKK